MALTLIVTPGGATSNGYVSVADADTYHAYHPYASVWNDAEADSKIQAIVWATRILDEQIEWQGYRVTQAQLLRWPRSTVQDRDGYPVDFATIPKFLKDATAELARHLLSKDRFQTLDDAIAGLRSVSAGSVSVEFDSMDRIPLLPGSVRSLISGYILGTSQASGGFEVSLLRT